jgi:hypothetical protein
VVSHQVYSHHSFFPFFSYFGFLAMVGGVVGGGGGGGIITLCNRILLTLSPCLGAFYSPEYSTFFVER